MMERALRRTRSLVLGTRRLHLWGDRDSTAVRGIQQMLTDCGYDPGPIDGRMGRRTRDAWSTYAKDTAMTPLSIDFTVCETGILKKIPTQWKAPPRQGEVHSLLGNPEYKEVEGGYIQWQGRWEEDNLVTIRFGPHVLRVCKYVAKTFRTVATDLEAVGAMDEVKTAVSYSPRHILHSAQRPISTHSYGLSVDINSEECKLGLSGNMDQRIVQVFENHGFTWGGRFRGVRDEMHFQICMV